MKWAWSSTVPLMMLGWTLATACSSTTRGQHSSSQPQPAQAGVRASANAAGKTDTAGAPASDGVGPRAPAAGGSGSGTAGGDGARGSDDVIVDETAPAATSDCYKGAPDICAIEVAIFKTVNQERAKAGLHALTFSSKTAWVARDWSTQQGSAGTISHRGWPEARESAFSKEFGGKLGTNAENVAMTSGDAEASVAADFMGMWMKSPGHRANILGESAAIGIGVAKTAGGEWYATQIFTSRAP